MRIRKIAFVGLLCISLVSNFPAALAAETVAPVPAPKGIPTNVWDTFYQVAFTGGSVSNSNLKWGTRPSISLMGNFTDADISTIADLRAGFKNVCPTLIPEITKNEGDILYVENKSPIIRTTEQTDNLHLVIEF